ncbi:MAG TPA: Mrp/NBP35 family ATP-binding protein [Holophagaceae bacterium]|nr:Mrp/NBP35 family ATP-binding protein [Holophagaceae bacterium]
MDKKISRASLFDALNAYQVPGTSATLVALKAVKGLDVDGGKITVRLQMLDAYQDREAEIRKAIAQRLGSVDGVEAVMVEIAWDKTPQVEFKNLLGGVKHALVVGSGKGGVGKSTVAANLAVAAAKLGLNVGLLDADLYGPSMGMMFGVGPDEGPEGTPEGKIRPVEKYGIKLMSMGFLIDEDKPVIWRGPMLNKALQQFLGDVLWGDLDILFIDLPPGTGDIQISLIQNAKVGGAVVVSTPQDVAFLDAKKAIGMFNTVKVPITGVIENMSSFLCPGCGKETQIFGHGGVKAAAARMELPFLGEIPIDLGIREGGDNGKPLVEAHPDSPQSKVFFEMAAKLKAQFAL